MKKQTLRFDPKTETITNLDTNEPYIIISFDESSQQLSSNSCRVWSLTKPKMVKNTSKIKSNSTGAYSLTTDGNDYIEFMENSKAESIIKVLENIREKNPKGIILTLIDNFSSHIAKITKEAAEKLGMDLLFLPTYSPSLQPVEKIWNDTKRDISQFKIDKIENYKELKKEKSEAILKEITEESFYEHTKSKSKWRKVLNNHIKPIIKKLFPKENTDWEVQKLLKTAKNQ